MHSLGTMWYNICHIIQYVLYNIQEVYIMALLSVMALCAAFQLLHIMVCLTAQKNRTYNTNGIYSAFIL